MSKKTALIVGASGIVGQNLARLLVSRGDWDVLGLARRPLALPGVEPIAADLQNTASLASALAGAKPSHVFLATWLRQPTERENVLVNAGMVKNLLDAVRPANTVEHVALVTGLKHYLGPFENYAKGASPATPLREEQPRLDLENFYYAQEDEVFAAAQRDGFAWSVHRPHTIIGYALGNAMNMGVTLAAHASLCKAAGKPFVFPGSAAQWNGLTDMTDAEQLAEHLLWATSTPAARDQAFNIVNGDLIRWKWLWPRLADFFGIEAAPLEGQGVPLAMQLADAGPAWRALAASEGLVEPDLDRLASPWHTDADLGRPFEIVTDMSKSRRLGFTGYHTTEQSFLDLFARLRAQRVIP